MIYRRSPLSTLSLVLVVLLTGCGGSPSGAPTAHAGGDGRVPLGATVVLDGSGSVDPDGDDLAHRWTLTARPPESDVGLAGARSAQVSFLPDAVGAYEAELAVTDGTAEARDTVLIDVLPNTAPVADAGDERVVQVGADVRLDGTDSRDPDGAALAFDWSFLTTPGDSVADFDDATARRPLFVADEPGTYRVQLVVTDEGATDSDVVAIHANRPPVAVASGPAQAPVNQIVRLDGTGSSDPDLDPLVHAWSFLGRPTGSSAVLDGADTASPRFVPDVVGRYTLELEVGDGRTTSTDVVAVEVTGDSGIVGRTVYVSPVDGDDGNSGSADAPFATLRTALATAADHEEIDRISLEGGEYAGPGYPHAIDSDVAILGPSEGSPPAVLDAGAEDLLRVGADVSVFLNRVTLRSGATAVQVAAGANLELGGVTCEAKTCVASGIVLFQAGGRVSLTDSVLDGRASGGDYGITVAQGTEVAVSRSRVEGFSTAGVWAFATPVGLIDATIVDNGIGLVLNMADASYGANVTRGVFEGNGTGLSASFAPRVVVDGTSFRSHTDEAVDLDGGASVVLNDVQIVATSADGIVVGGPDSDGEVLTMRDSVVEVGEGRGVVVTGVDSHADLGRDGDAGGNEVSGGDGLAILDARPSDASGLVTVNGTRLNGRYPKRSFFEGPGVFFEVTITGDNDILVD